MKTVLYDREKLANYLNIEVNQLPILALLAGNDLIPLESVRVIIFILKYLY